MKNKKNVPIKKKEKTRLNILLGKLFYATRKSKKIPVDVIASRTGFHRTSIFLYEKGAMPLTVEKFIILCKAYNLCYKRMILKVDILLKVDDDTECS